MVGPLISIVTATYNSEKHLEQTIASILGQTYRHIEYIIVDGGSTDGTLDIVDRYRSRIAKVISEPDRGIYDAFNKGYRASTGDIVYFLNSDDYLEDDNVIEEVASIFHAHPGLSIVYGNVRMHEEGSGFFYYYGKPVTIEDFKQGYMTPHPGFFARRSLFERQGGFSLDYPIAGDFEFVIKCFLSDGDKAYYFDRTIANFRIGGTSSSLKNYWKTRAEGELITKKLFATESKPLSTGEYNFHYYRAWFEALLLQKRSLSSVLRGVRRAAIFGSMKLALFLLEDMRQAGIETVCFLDNDGRRQNHTMRSVPIYGPDWLREQAEQIDAVILSFEGRYDEEVKAQIRSLIGERELLVLSWRELAEMSFDRA
ncbi:glycosyl transferase, group 2 family protein, putative [Heliomicrobium modesticaldum Ice1]|uniref:Glycosyl transferase, group 2 family protein, putative n=1 Tax=Heliobacterium modesticaldum (strain ATCC 51547 / Ice1) TaxID=498761 RepID=B0TH23_HELMI|nr:glycosyltransferase family 2 protein [Heliomicrobium modesticaldum]ABZ83348.1 glycosyl transferase, group 2 family protein, putative [Heliomicrobium modesticaldum Ice1]